MTFQTGSIFNAEINSTSATSDLLEITGSLTLNGNLNISNLGTNYTANTSFTLFSATTISGTFTTITLPTITNGLIWDISELYTSGKISLVKGSQNITFNTLSNIPYETADFDPGAAVSSGLLLTYTSSNTDVATIVTDKIHVVAPGSTNIIAAQPGNDYYSAATTVTQPLTITLNTSTQTLVENSVTMYPNPVSGNSLTLKLSANYTSKITLTILNSIGQVLKKEERIKNTLQ